MKNEKLKVMEARFAGFLSQFFFENKEDLKMVLPIPTGDDKLVFDYLGQLFKFAEENNFRFPGRSALAAVTLMENNIRRGQWVARAIVMLANAGFKYVPLPTPEVCEIMGLDELAKSLRAPGEK